jgi:formylglycine-generating enzyme required for sulfatase activity
MTMRVIPPGEFLMGTREAEMAKLMQEAAENKLADWSVANISTESPQHRVTLTQPLAMSAHEVTRGQFRKFVEAAKYKTDALRDVDPPLSDNVPVTQIYWADAAAFCEWLSEEEKATYRLPTEAEWEFACRAGNPGRYCFGDDAALLDRHAWYASSGVKGAPQAVGQKESNAFGLFDMHGNVSEWCLDHFGKYTAEPVTDPQGEGTFRVMRGGVVGVMRWGNRSASRAPAPPDFRNHVGGFRVVREFMPPPPRANAPFHAAQAKAHQEAWAAQLGVRVEYANSNGMKFRLIPPGEFLMGSDKGDPNEAPVHKVTLTRPFYLGLYEVTQEEYEAVIGSNPSKFNGKRLPVEFLTTDEAAEFCRKLSEKDGKKYRLPTEAEWEFACRGGTTTEWSFGDDPATLGDYAWHNENAEAKSHPVGEKKPNPFGLFDMHGNVFEYCSDYTGAYAAEAAVDPQGPALGRYRGFRGGSWFFKPFDTRSADRQDKDWPARGSHVGFRVLLEVDASQRDTRQLEGSDSAASPTVRNRLGMDLALIPKGKSWLGGGGGTPGEKAVEIADDFYLGAHEVTQAEWLKVTGLNPSQFRGVEGLSEEEALRLPVEKVSWEDAQLFFQRLNEQDPRQGWVYRLPTEAEWEYACRGGPRSDLLECGFHYYLAERTNELPPAQANYSHPEAVNRTVLVGSYASNILGLFDMHGNVWEWCQDEAPPDPLSGSTEPHRAMRGGSWNSNADSCRAAHSLARPASFRGMHVGLRVALVRKPPAESAATAPPSK